MFNPNDFDADLHLTLVLMSVVFTLTGLHLMQFILSGRSRVVQNGTKHSASTQTMTCVCRLLLFVLACLAEVVSCHIWRALTFCALSRLVWIWNAFCHHGVYSAV